MPASSAQPGRESRRSGRLPGHPARDVSLDRGRSPGSRVRAAAGLPGVSPVTYRQPLAAHSCGGSSGGGPWREAMPVPDSLFAPG